MKFLKTLLLILSIVFFTACGGNGSSSNTTQTTAIDKITAFAKDGTPIPSVQDYLDAGVVGVTETNLAEINEIVSNLTPEEVDTTEEIQTITNNVANVSLAPVAVATVSKSFVTEGATVRFSAENSTDADGNIVSYEWKEGSTVLFTISVFDKSDFSVGKHTLTLTVTDNDGNSNSATVNVTVEEKEVEVTLSKRVHSLNGVCKVYVEQTGIDSNNNGVLDDDEVKSTTAETFTNGTPITIAELQAKITANDDVTSVNTCQITDMVNLFNGNSTFNQDIGSWNTGAVTTMQNMFYRAKAFNQNIGSWDTSKVIIMNSMFKNANVFNQNIGSWDTSKVTNMSSMFENAAAFNQNLSNWVVIQNPIHTSFSEDSSLSSSNLPKFP